MDDEQLRELRGEVREARETIAEVLRILSGLAGELERYRALLPEPGTVKARVLRRAAGRAAVDHWNGG